MASFRGSGGASQAAAAATLLQAVSALAGSSRKAGRQAASPPARAIGEEEEEEAAAEQTKHRRARQSLACELCSQPHRPGERRGPATEEEEEDFPGRSFPGSSRLGLDGQAEIQQVQLNRTFPPPLLPHRAKPGCKFRPARAGSQKLRWDTGKGEKRRVVFVLLFKKRGEPVGFLAGRETSPRREGEC